LYAVLVDRCPEPLLVIDADAAVLGMNAAAHALAPVADRAGLPASMRVDAPPLLIDAMQAAGDWSGRLSLGFTTTGRVRWFDGVVAPLPETRRFLCLLRGATLSAGAGDDAFGLQPTLDAVPPLLWMTGPDHSLEWCNTRWSDYTGRSALAGGAGAWLAELHAEDVERCTGILHASAEARQPFALDVRLRGADGRHRWMLFNATPRLAADGGFGGYVGSAIDIDERKQLEDSLAERVRTLRHAERRQAGFLSLLSHELRSPLAPIANAASVLRTLEDRNPILVRLREILERQVERLGQMVETLIDGTRSAQGQISLVSEPVAIDGMVRGAVARSSELLTARGHTLEVDLPEQRHFVKGDAARLSQALSNIISNAAKFTPRPDTIRLSVEPVAPLIRITVADHGQGIRPDFLPHVFELFAQQDRAQARNLGGLGVGLTFARRIAQMHGGALEAFSDGPDQGARLVMTLPLASDTAFAVNPQAQGPGLAESYRVLIIEDDADAREALRLQMRMWGNEVMTAADGEEGLRAAELFKPHIVLCDLGLPGIGGLELIGPLRQQLAQQSTLFAAVTGRSADETRALAVGFDSFLVKPLHADGLAKLLRSYASRVR
jgi:PAS domain S-box-containing protein